MYQNLFQLYIMLHMKLKTILMTAFSAVIFSLSMPNEMAIEGLPLLAFVGLAPFFWALMQKISHRWAGLLGLVFAVVTTQIQFFWLSYFQNWALFTLGGVTLGFILLYSILAQVMRWIAGHGGPHRWVWMAVAWAVFEFFKSNGFIAFPWGLSPYPLHSWLNLVQIVDVYGLTILSFFIAGFNLWIAQRLTDFKPLGKESMGQLGALYLTTLLFLVYGAGSLSQNPEVTSKAQLVLVQKNADPWVRSLEQVKNTLSTGVRLSSEALSKKDLPPIDLIIWSETSLTFTFNQTSFYEKFPEELPLNELIRRSQTHWLFGNIFYPNFPDTSIAQNATLFVNPQAQIVDHYGKRKLVPMAEGIPFWHVDWVRDLISGTLGLRPWTPGSKPTVFELPLKAGGTLKFGTPICFEDAFPFVVNELVQKGSQILVNVSNDTWSKTVSAQNQHHLLARFRAIETKRYLIRSTNSGTSGMIDPWGRKVGPFIPWFTDTYTPQEIPIYKTYPLTAYVLWGDWLAYLMVVALVLKGLGCSWIGERLRSFLSFAFYRR